MKNILLLFLLLLFLTSVKHCSAIYNPLTVANNLFGIHVVDENDLNDAANLINSSGGDWGYVTIIIREDDRNVDKWQNVFNKMRRLHLIPIVRLATKVENANWIKPRAEDVGSWADFLNTLNWVVQNRYVIIFNEPNHAKEWGGKVDPEEYGWFLKEFSRKLKEKSEDFFILPAGLDASAPNSAETVDETVFVKRMITKEPDVFKSVDGWTSHSYPNPGFSGNPFSQGRGTIRTYLWEKGLLSQYGINDLPIFITETGWQHSNGVNLNSSLISPETASQNYQIAFSQIWKDDRIAAITPFLLNYQSEPFDHFSWKKLNSFEFYPVYESVKNISKTRGEPKQLHKARIYLENLPVNLITRSDYYLHFDVENLGQSLIGENDKWKIEIADLPMAYTIKGFTQNIDPGQLTRIDIHLKTSAKQESYNYKIRLKYNDQIITEVAPQLNLIPPPSLLLQAEVWIKKAAEGSDYSLIIYDDQEKISTEIKPVEFHSGLAVVNDLFDVVPYRKYRLVITKPYYLPRQTYSVLGEKTTTVKFPRLLPFDPSNDGKLSKEDIQAFFQKPLQTIGLLVNM